MKKIYSSIEELTGETPLLELRRISSEFKLEAKILAKLECFNPAGSIKDRIAMARAIQKLPFCLVVRTVLVSDSMSHQRTYHMAMKVSLCGKYRKTLEPTVQIAPMLQ